MEHQEKEVPNLRFKGFTDPWEQRKLGEVIVSEHKGKVKSSMKGGNTNYLETNYLNGGVAQKVNVRADVSKNDVLILWDGSKAGTVYHGFEGALGSTLKAYVPKCSGDFLYQILKKDQDKIYQRYRTPNIPHVIKNFTEKFIVLIPDVREQEKIAEFFNQLDSLIALQQRKLDLLKQLKKGLLQKMFADKGSKRPILRFEGFNDDWEGRKLENSADYIRGSFPQPYGNKEWYGGTNAKPFVQVVDVNTNMRLNKKTKEQISVLAQPKSRFVPSDSIVVTLQGSIGRVAITQYDSYVDRTLLIFTKYKVPVDKYFWAYSIQNIFRIEKQKAPGGTIKTITKRALSSFEVSLPVQEEQKKISTLLKNIDDIITSQQEEVSKLKKIKKSLLQQMFI